MTKYILTIISIATCLFSCTKLKDQNYSTIVSEDFTAGSSDVAAIVGAAYTYWRNVELGRSANSVFRTNEISSDEMVIPKRPNGWVDGGIYQRVHQHKFTSDDDNSYTIWNNAYAGINTCNRIIYQIESKSLTLEDDLITPTLAELKVLRASYYYVLLDFFGNVPIITQFDVPDGYTPEQSQRKDVYNFVVSEILANQNDLNNEKSTATYGKFNKWAALTLLAKVYLNAGVYTGTAQWDSCRSMCDSVINSGIYALDANQSSVFATENEGSNEIIFSIPFDEKYTSDGSTAFTLHMETLQPENQATYNFQQAPWGGICAVPQFISTYDTTDARYKQWIRGIQYSSTGSALIGTMGAVTGQVLSYINELPGVDSSEENHGFREGKFEFASGALVGLSNDFPLFRYADVLMMKAESLLRSNNAAQAAEIVTQVRMRNFSDVSKATVSAADLQKGSSYDYGLRNHITVTHEGGADVTYGRFLDELGWEFAGEGRRRQDMIRFGIFTTKSWLSHSPSDINHILLPIPRDALNTNSHLVQNLGY